jgi:Flp pilus assembly protein TadD
MSKTGNEAPPPKNARVLGDPADRVRAFLQGEATLGDVYGLTHEELYGIAGQGKRLFDAGQLDDAFKVFEGLVALNPYDYNFHVGLGAVLQRQGKLDQALLEYDRALQLNERDVAAYANRAEVLMEKGEIQRAIDDLAAVARLDPEAKDPHARRARAMAVALTEVAKQKSAR